MHRRYYLKTVVVSYNIVLKKLHTTIFKCVISLRIKCQENYTKGYSILYVVRLKYQDSKSALLTKFMHGKHGIWLRSLYVDQNTNKTKRQ